ncbi:MAG: pyridoxal-phosphate dependent enzyme, partial [Lachnospiraceae bacterium]|nr:pyridoxal-phosphate dependent enzyme [Lachnospiraceae bacterium]
GVGGAPSGITFGLKECFGDHVRCLIAEPVEAPSMLLGMATGLHDGISVKDIGLSGKTAADGLAVGRPSKFAGRAVEELVSAAVTVKDERLFVFLRALWEREHIFIEPSAAAGFMGAVRLKDMEKLLSAFTEKQLENAVHIVWATGGSMVPAEERSGYLSTPEDEKTNEA